MRRLFLFVILAWPVGALSAEINVLHDGPVLADGASAHRVYLEVPGLVATDKVRLKTREGVVLGHSIPMPGLLAIDLSGTPLDTAGALSLRVRVKGGIELDKVVSLPLQPVATGTLKIELTPPDLIGGLQRVEVRVRAEGPAHLPHGARPFALSATVGEIESLQAAGDGTWTAFYIPPVDLDEAVVVLFTATDLSAPENVVGFASLAFGQSVAEPTEEEAAPAWSAKTGRLAFAPLPEGTAVPAGQAVRLHLAAVNAAGQPVTNVSEALFSVGSSLDVQGPGSPKVTALGPGLFAVDVVVPQQAGAFSVVAQPGDHEARIDLQSVGVLPALSLRTDPEFISKDTRDMTLTTWAKDATGRTLPGLSLGLELEGGTIRGGIEDGGGGSYTAKVRLARDSAGLKVELRPALSVSELPPARVRIWTLADAVALGTTSEMVVGVVVEDAFGLPVPSAVVDLAVPIGGGALPPKVETGESGIGHVRYVPGLDTGPALLRASTENGMQHMVLLWQVPRGQSAPLLMMPGAESTRLDSNAWRLAFPSATLVRGAAPVVAAPAPLQTAAEPVQAAVEPIPSAVDVAPSPEPFGTSTTQWSEPAAASVADAPPPGGTLSRSLFPFRVFARLQYTGYEFSQKADEYEDLVGTSDNPAEFSVSLPQGVVGLGLAAEYWLLDGGLAGDFVARVGRYTVDLGDGSEGQALSDLRLGLRYRGSLGSGFSAEGGLWLHRMGMVAMRYQDAQTRAELVSFGIVGARIGGAIDRRLGPVDLKLDLAETLTPKPAATHVGLGMQITLDDVEVSGMPMLLDVGYSMDLRHLALPVDGDEANVLDLQHAFLLGAGIAL